jgi:xanthine dehydrogenase large subunit
MPAVGKSVPHDSSRDHLRGRSIFLDDTPALRNELLVDFFGSPVARGHIVKLDLEPARAIPGIVGLFTYHDVPGQNLYGPIFQDEYFLAEEHVSFLGEPMVVIAGENQAAIDAAKRAIVVEIEVETPITTIEAALAAESFIGPLKQIKRGDTARAIAKAPHTIKGELRVGGQEHLYMETNCALVIPGEGGHLTIYSSTQNPTEAQNMAAKVLGLGQHQVVCICKRMGGGFGGKESQATPPALMAGLVAQKTGRPARCAYSRATDMRVTGKRHPFLIRYEAGFDSEGHILAAAIEFYSDGGCAADLSTSVLDRALFHADNAYFIPEVEFTGRVCRTNLASNTAFRGFGGGQGIIAIENIIEEMASVLGKDAAEIRLLNCYGPEGRNVTPYGQVVTDETLPSIYQQLLDRFGYAERRQQLCELNASGGDEIRGLSATMVKFGISFTSKFLNQANALVNVYTDGTVQVSTGGTEMGQGLNTKIRQLVADEFGISPQRVAVMPTSTEKNNNTPPTAASAGTDLNGSAAVLACRAIRERLAVFAAERLASQVETAPEQLLWEDNYVWDPDAPEHRISFTELVHAAHRERISLGERGHYVTPGLGPSQPFFYFTSGAAVAEVVINKWTGELRVARVDVLMDIGQSINPAIDKGQISGGFMQGLGWVTMEELRYGPGGQLLPDGPYGYKIPSIADTPGEFNIHLMEGTSFPPNVRSSKAVGEPPLLLGLCVWTAVKDALNSAKPGHKTELSLPATNEEILCRLMAAKPEVVSLAPLGLTPVPLNGGAPQGEAVR